MQFTKRLRARIVDGEITCTIRIWTCPHVKPGGRYRLGDSHIHVDSIAAIELAEMLVSRDSTASLRDVADPARHSLRRSRGLLRRRRAGDDLCRIAAGSRSAPRL